VTYTKTSNLFLIQIQNSRLFRINPLYRFPRT